jgi:PAS domain S-box-containing protein
MNDAFTNSGQPEVVRSRQSLASYIGAVLSLCAVLVTVVLSFVLERAVHKTLSDGIGAGLAQLASQTSSRLDHELSERLREVQSLALRLSDVNRAEAQWEIEHFKQSHSSYAWVAMTDRTGKIRAASAGALQGLHVSTYRRFLVAQGLGAHVFDDLDSTELCAIADAFQAQDPPLFLHLAFQVDDLRGGHQGVVGVCWNWGDDVRQSVFAPAPGAAVTPETLTPADNQVFTSFPDATVVLENLTPAEGPAPQGAVQSIVLSRDHRVLLGPKELKGSQLSTTSASLAAEGKSGYHTELWPDGKTYMVGYSRPSGFLPDTTPGWRVLVRQEVTAAYAPIHALQELMLWVGGGVIVLFVGVGWMAARTISRPLQQLAGSAARYESGRSSLPRPSWSYREVDQLAKAVEARTRCMELSGQALAASEEQLQGIMRTAMDGIVTVNEDLQIVMFNDAAQVMFQIDRSQALGMSMLELMPEQSAHAHVGYIREFTAKGDQDRLMRPARPISGRRSNGDIFPIEASVSWLIGPDGKRLFTVIMRDITVRVRYQDTLLRTNQELQEFSDHFERTVLKQLEALQAATARELHDSIGSNLTAISLQLGEARRMDLDHRSAALIDRAQDAVRQTIEISRHLARGLMPVGTDPGALIHALEHYCSDLSDLRSINCQLLVTCDLDSVAVEVGNHVYRIVQEAVTNAVRHGGASQVVIRFSKAHDYIVTVTDNGSGFDYGELMCAQQPGIGLASMRARAKAIGGEIAWERQKNRGMRVRLSWHPGAVDVSVPGAVGRTGSDARPGAAARGA